MEVGWGEVWEAKEEKKGGTGVGMKNEKQIKYKGKDAYSIYTYQTGTTFGLSSTSHFIFYAFNTWKIFFCVIWVPLFSFVCSFMFVIKF